MMDAFDLIALALWCQVAQQVPWRRCWAWLWAKALALRSWVFKPEDYVPRGGWPKDEHLQYTAPVRDAEDWGDDPLVVDVSDIESVDYAKLDVTVCAAPKPRRRPSRAAAAKARKAKKQ